MRVYVSGPMTGYEEFNYPAFHKASRQLREAGYEVTSPAEVCPAADGLTWVDYLRADIKALCDCDAVGTLPGWEKSKGATLEVHIARELGFPVHTVEQLLLASERAS